MTTALLAGFECGHLGWSNHDLLKSTRHLPHDRMAAHYRIAQSHGLARARDGLPWRHGLEARLRMADDARMDVTWDLSHFDRPDNPVAHARSAAIAANPTAPFCICPVNEPAMYPALVGMPRHETVDMAIEMTRVAKDHHPDVQVLTTDPINGVGDRQFECTDALVATGLVNVIGVNYFPHTARTRLSKVLVKTARRYGLPVMVSETSWHDGHHEQERRYPGWNKGTWLRHVLDEVDVAKAKGADVVGVCWYPIIDSPPWPTPRSRHRWSHGLIREDLSVDPNLSEALRPVHHQPRQIAFEFA